MLSIESTELGDMARNDASDHDRGALNPRPKSLLPAKKGSKLLLPLLTGAGFVVVVAGSSVGGGKPVSDGLKTEKEAAETAQQAARAVVEDPLGNQPLPEAGPSTDPASLVASPDGLPNANGQVVPAIETAGLERQRGDIQTRQEREQQRRDQARALARARSDAMRRAPLMALVSGRATPAQAGQGGTQARAGQQYPPLREQTALESRLQASSIATVRATALPNRNFLITAGTLIPCVLQTAMDSTLPGLTSCVVPRTVLSDNGRVVLLEKGTRVLGEYQGGLQQGQNRIFIIWNRAVTPRGVAIDLGSPAADQLGRAGMGGDVETFFLKRFGGALLLSVVGDLGSAASDRLSGANETSRAPSQAAGIALQNDLRIQPRLRAPQGTEMTIFVARDFDFSRIYSLKLKR